MDGPVEESWRQERRGRLLEAAARVFARNSYDQASMDEIAAEAGVGKPTLYRYFSGKNALFSAVFVEALDVLEAQLAQVLETEHGLQARLVGLVRALVPTVRDHLVSNRFIAEQESAAEIDRSNRMIFRERRARICRFFAEAIEDEAACGRIRPEIDPDRAAHLIIGAIWSGAADSRGDAQSIADEVVALVVHGLALPPDGPSLPRGAPSEEAPPR